MILIRKVSFRDSTIYTIAWVAFDEPCWYAPQIEAALDTTLGDLGDEWIENVDFVHLAMEDAIELFEPLDLPSPEVMLRSGRLLFPTGLTLACQGRTHGAELRRLLLDDAAEEVREELERTKVERELGILYRHDEMEDRAHKARVLHRAVEAARRGGPLDADDAGYAACLASIAEVATGMHFPLRVSDDNHLADRFGVQRAWIGTAAERRARAYREKAAGSHDIENTTSPVI